MTPLQILSWLALLVILVVACWAVSVIPRVRWLKGRYRGLLTKPLPVWTPPKDEPTHDLSVPAFSDVNWQALSPKVDTEGIFVVDYDAVGQRGVGGKQRNPSWIVQFGVKNAQAYLENRGNDHLTLALRQFQYLVGEAKQTTVAGEATVVWCAEFDLGHQYQAKAPWKSAFFQAHCICAVLWLYWLTGEKQYAELAETGLIPLEHGVNEGGLSFVTPSDGLFFQEVVTTPLHHILNGHLNVLASVYHIAEFTGSARARRIFERGVEGTVDMLPAYDKYGYSLYSLSPNPGIKNHFNIAASSYHHYHVAYLRLLHELTGRQTFRDYADKWEKKTKGPFDVLWITVQVMFKNAMKLIKSV